MRNGLTLTVQKLLRFLSLLFDRVGGGVISPTTNQHPIGVTTTHHHCRPPAPTAVAARESENSATHFLPTEASWLAHRPAPRLAPHHRKVSPRAPCRQTGAGGARARVTLALEISLSFSRLLVRRARSDKHVPRVTRIAQHARFR